jgi:hypothetical protein
MHFQAIDYIPWLGSATAESLLVLVMLTRGLIWRFPFFFASIFYDVLRQATLFIIAHLSLGKVYFYTFWISVPVEYTLGFAVMFEAVRHAFQAEKFSPRAVGWFATLTAALVFVAATLVFHPSVPMDNLTGLILILDRSCGVLRCGVLLFILAFASRLGISWRHHVWGIVFGLGTYAGIGLIVGAIHAATGQMCGDWITPVPVFGYFSATIIWPIYLCRPEPEREALTLAQISTFSDLVTRYRRIASELAAVLRRRQ